MGIARIGRAGAWGVAARDQAGFTLLELLIAITLTGMLLVLLYSGLRLGMRSWDAGEAAAEQTNELRLAQEFIRRQLKASVTVFRPAEGQPPAAVFAGEPEGVVVVAPMLSHLGLGGLYVIGFDVVHDDGVGRLRMRWRPYRPGDPGTEGEQTAILLDGVADVRWAYFGSDRPDQAPAWRERWQNPSQRPELVRLSLVFRGEPWPDLVARMPTGSPSP